MVKAPTRLARQMILDFTAPPQAQPTPAVVTSSLDDEPAPARPRRRGECPEAGPDGVRVCPWVGCRHHLALDAMVHRRHGQHRLVLNPVFIDADGDLRLDTGLPMCALDVADLQEAPLSLIGALLGLSRERVNQILAEAIDAMRDGMNVAATDAMREAMKNTINASLALGDGTEATTVRGWMAHARALAATTKKDRTP